MSAMPISCRPGDPVFRLKSIGLALACALLAHTAAHAAGLGRLTVLSALGQPLRAEIELTSVAPDEAGALVAKLAPQEAFRQVNIDFNPALLALRFSIDQRGKRQFIRIQSTVPIKEPFIDMLLELTCNGSYRQVREYTFLLDPADLGTLTAPRTKAPAVQAPGPGAKAAPYFPK